MYERGKIPEAFKKCIIVTLANNQVPMDAKTFVQLPGQRMRQKF